MKTPILDQINLVCSDINATLSFYREMGVDIPEELVWTTATGAHHVEVKMPGGFELSFDSPALAQVYNSGHPELRSGRSNNIMSFRLGSADDVDLLYDKMVKKGHPGSQQPYTTFWGSRYAIVEDPDGNWVEFLEQS